MESGPLRVLGATALLMCACALDNPLFGLVEGATEGSVSTEGGADADGGSRTGANDGTNGDGGGTADGTNGSDDDDDDATSADGDDDDDDDDDDAVDSDGDSMSPEECTFEPVGVLADTFLDGTGTCAMVGFCDELDFGGTTLRLIGMDGTLASVYVVEFDSFAVPDGAELVGAEVFVPLAPGPVDALAIAFPVPLPVEFGTADGRPNPGASTWSHLQYNGVPWYDPDTMTEVFDFGSVMDWAYDQGVVMTQSVDASEDLPDAPLGYAFDVPEPLLTSLVLAAQNGEAIRLGLTTDDLFNGWRVSAGGAVLELAFCQP